MEYFRDPNKQIYASFACRLRKILIQYEKMECSEEKYVHTLYIAALHSLVTYCRELLRSMTDDVRIVEFNKTLSESDWGLDDKCWIEKYRNKPKLKHLIICIRNSLSHPTNTKTGKNVTLPSTGFLTIPDNTGKIVKYEFIDSPDVDYNGNIKEDSLERAKKGKLRIAKINLTTKQLMSFVNNLALYLAQPIQENWDGKTINKHICNIAA